MNEDTVVYAQDGDAVIVWKTDDADGLQLGVQINDAEGRRRAAVVVKDDEPKGGRAGDMVAGQPMARTADGRPQWHTVVGVMPPRGAGPPQVIYIFEGAVMPVVSGKSDWFPDGQWSHVIETPDPMRAGEIGVAKQQQIWLARNGGYGPRPAEEPARPVPGWERYPLPEQAPAGFGDDTARPDAGALYPSQGPVEQINIGNPFGDGEPFDDEEPPFNGPGAQLAWDEHFRDQPEQAAASGGRRRRR